MHNSSEEKTDIPERGRLSKAKHSHSVWPPPPLGPNPQTTNKTQNLASYLTGIGWLDAILGIPAGFISGFILYAASAVLVQAIHKPPFHRPQTLAISAIGAVQTLLVYALIGRRHLLFAFTMCLGGIPFYLLMVLLAWYIP